MKLFLLISLVSFLLISCNDDPKDTIARVPETKGVAKGELEVLGKRLEAAKMSYKFYPQLKNSCKN